MKYKTELTNKVQLCFSLRKYQKNLSDNWKVSHQWICADKACILQVELAELASSITEKSSRSGCS